MLTLIGDAFDVSVDTGTVERFEGAAGITCGRKVHKGDCRDGQCGSIEQTRGTSMEMSTIYTPCQGGARTSARVMRVALVRTYCVLTTVSRIGLQINGVLLTLQWWKVCMTGT